MSARLSDADLQLIDRVIDGAESDADRELFSTRMHDAEFARVYEETGRLKEIMGAQERLRQDPVFWSKVAGSLERRKAEKEDLLPVPRRYVPVFAGALVLLLLFAASYMFQNRLSFIRFWESNAEAVRSAVGDGVSPSSFLPVFSNLDADRALQFALYGSLPLDDERGTTINVDERSSEGYKIEVQKELPRKQKKVTVDQFVAEVRPTTSQRVAIDSLLSEGRKELQTALLVGENNALAINADLSRMNRAMASGIVGVLQPDQRIRLNRLLSERDMAYGMPPPAPENAAAREALRAVLQAGRHREFVILTPESIGLARMQFDIERMQRRLEDGVTHRQWEERRARAMEMLIDRPGVFGGSVPGAAVAPKISLRARKDRLTIHVLHDSIVGGVHVFGAIVGPALLDSGEHAGVDDFLPLPEGAPTGVRVYTIPPGRPVVVADSLKAVEKKPRRPFKLDID